MAIPAIVYGIGAAVTAAYAAIPDGYKKIGKDKFLSLFDGAWKHFEGEAMAAVFEKMGLPGIDPEEGLTPQSITRAINNGPLAGSGVELRNLFDKSMVREDLMKVGLMKAAQSIGFEVDSPTVQGIEGAIKKWISGEVRKQIDEGGGELIDGAPDLSAIVSAIRSGMKGWKEGDGGEMVKDEELDMTPEGVSNRERQARYRASHKREWEHLSLGAGHTGD